MPNKKEDKEQQSDLTDIRGKSKYDVVNRKFVSTYSPDVIVSTIRDMNATRRHYKGKFIPNFTELSEQLNIPTSTLKNWYDNQEKVLKSLSQYLGSSQALATIKLSDTSLKAIQEVVKRLDDPDAMKKERLKDVSYTMSELIKNLRLLSNQSTQNIEHAGSVELRSNIYEAVVPDDCELASPKTRRTYSDLEKRRKKGKAKKQSRKKEAVRTPENAREDVIDVECEVVEQKQSPEEGVL